MAGTICIILLSDQLLRRLITNGTSPASFAGRFVYLPSREWDHLASKRLLTVAIRANLIGGLFFFRVNRYIFPSPSLVMQWEARASITCVGCGRIARDYLLVQFIDYNGTNDHKPESRGEDGSRKISEGLRERSGKQIIILGSNPRRTAFFSQPLFQLYSNLRIFFFIMV
jgi:hypothetical protein